MQHETSCVNAKVRAMNANSDAITNKARDVRINDPPTCTPFEIVHEGGLLRLRHYEPVAKSAGPPVMLVYSLIKRPYILDLVPTRSVVRSLLRQGFSVYLTDWLPPELADAGRGFDAYVNEDLARAVACVQRREGVEQISLIGCCFGGILCVIYAALHPATVKHLVPFASPFEMHPALVPGSVECVTAMYGNVPAWLIHAGLNAQVPARLNLPLYLAQDLGEPELVQSNLDSEPRFRTAIQKWMNSDVPLAGRVFREMMRDAYWNSQLAENRLRVGDQQVTLEHITCPVLNIAGVRDQLVPPESAAALIEHVGSREASNLVFPTGHLGLMVSLAAQRDLWPRIGNWLRTNGDQYANAAT